MPARENVIPKSKQKWIFGSINNTDHKLHMLAANIRVKVAAFHARSDDSGSKNDETSCPLLFADDLAANTPCAPDDSTVTGDMDWLLRIDQSLDPTRESSLKRQARQNSEFAKQLMLNQQKIVLHILYGYKCKAEGTLKELVSSSADSNFSCEAFEAPGLNDPTVLLNQLTAELHRANRYYASPDQSSDGVFISPASRMQAVRLLLLLIAREQKDIGYTIAALPSGKHVLIIGVVGQETMQEISPDYFKVLPDVQDCRAPNASNSKNAVCQMKALPREKRIPLPLFVGDPRFVVSTLLRAVWAAQNANDPKFDEVVVMAQMPPSEAEELGTHVRVDIEKLYLDETHHLLPERPSVDLILSEAQRDYATPDTEVGLGEDKLISVFTPSDAFTRLSYPDPNPISAATLHVPTHPGHHHIVRVLTNHPAVPADPAIDFANSSDADPHCESAACLLQTELVSALSLEQIRHNVTLTTSAPDLRNLWDRCEKSQNCQNTVVMQYLLHQLQRSSRADVVLLKRRDFYFGQFKSEYGDYEICDTWIGDVSGGARSLTPDEAFEKQYCRLHVALDRILWKGDYSDRVMVDGATLTGLMKTSQQQSDLEASLMPRDLHQEWLMTFGIATTPPTNLVVAASGPESFSLPGIEGCKSSANPPLGKAPASGASITPYCVDGLTVASDHAYWVATSNQLAEDQTIYSALGSLATMNSGHNVSAPEGLFLTTEIARELLAQGQPAEFKVPYPPLPTSDLSELSLVTVEKFHENRNLLQLDVSKLVASYNMTSPNLSDNSIANSLSGVSNSQASTPHSQELDLEASARLISAPLFERLALGLQTDFEYDRKVTGNLNGNPETVVYSPSMFTVGGFTQLQLHSKWPSHFLAPIGINQSTRNLPRALLVIAPYQFQRQITGTYLGFSYFTPPNTPNSQKQLTVRVPTAMGFSQRAGLRYETGGLLRWGPDTGSYAEIGPEYSVQNNVLSALLLPQLPVPFNLCNVSATQSLQTCVKANYKSAGVPLDGSSVITPVTKTMHSGGFYWDVHVQKTLDYEKRYSVSFDTKGDSFLLPGTTLTTQTRYAFNTKLALNIKIAGNLSLSPTYSDFFFENQGISSQRTGLIATTFSIAAKWYYARDAQVPLLKQTWYSGPASIDQTSSAKTK